MDGEETWFSWKHKEISGTLVQPWQGRMLFNAHPFAPLTGWRLSDHDLTTGCVEQSVLQELSIEIVRLMEGGALLPSLKRRGLVGQEDEEFLFDSCSSRRQQNQFLLHLISQQVQY